MKSKESETIEILCGAFGDQYVPLSRAEFWKLYHEHGDSIERMANSENERIRQLMERKGAIAFGKEKIDQMGIRILTFLDEEFPKCLSEQLRDFCPPLLYCSGGNSILENKFVGYVGSRTIEEADISWTQERVKKNIHDGYGVVTGGAKGVDTVAMSTALEMGGKVLLFLPDNIKQKIREPFILQNICDGNILVYSHVSPLAVKGKNSFVAAAMERNKYIYAASTGTAVVRSDLKKGGTWSGAVEAIKHHWAPVFVWDNKNYPGNQELIRMGALALADDGSRVAEMKDNIKTGDADDSVKNANECEMRQMTLDDYFTTSKNII